jgi:hypothetical protein
LKIMIKGEAKEEEMSLGAQAFGVAFILAAA